jgi:hypothetical protein
MDGKTGRPRALKEAGKKYMRRYSKNAKRVEPGYPCPPRILEKMFTELASGRLLSDIAREKWAPSQRTYLRWVREWPKVAESYSLAKKIRLEGLYDQIRELADSGDIERVKHQIKTRQWTAAHQAHWIDNDQS